MGVWCLRWGGEAWGWDALRCDAVRCDAKGNGKDGIGTLAGCLSLLACAFSSSDALLASRVLSCPAIGKKPSVCEKSEATRLWSRLVSYRITVHERS